MSARYSFMHTWLPECCIAAAAAAAAATVPLTFKFDTVLYNSAGVSGCVFFFYASGASEWEQGIESSCSLKGQFTQSFYSHF